jgi:hypothetical protein
VFVFAALLDVPFEEHDDLFSSIPDFSSGLAAMSRYS